MLRRIMLAASLVATMVAMMLSTTVPALAADWNDSGDNSWTDWNHNGDNSWDNHFFDNRFFDPFNDNEGINQTNEQEVQSGDATQTFNVSGGGDNSNQCVGIQGVTNTGNSVNNTSVLQANPFNNQFDNRFDNRFDNQFDNRFFDNRFDNRFFDNGFFDNGFNGGDVEIQDTGNFTINPTSTTTCDQQVNQAASAS